ncbi:hypothetical protein [Actinocorallia longicatena]|uniref:Uncharacterized protein n=1 Tax=Actinocorallia longicatena TaxID=111803 RepID=A0ABP6QB84_9ACTN
MSILFTVEQLPAEERFDMIREVTAATWVPMECASEFASDFRTVLRVSGPGAVQVAVLDVMPMTAGRTPKLISRADPDPLKMFMVCGGGSTVIDQGGQQAVLAPGGSPSTTRGARMR